MHLTPSAVALALALTPAFAAADTRAPVPTGTQETRALATTLVEVGDEREREAKALEPLEGMLSAQVAMRLSTTDPQVVAQIKQVVHDALSPVVQKAGDALVDGYAANFSTEELGHVVAFVESPEGQAEKANLALMKKELAAATSGSPDTAKAGDAAAQTFADASPEKRALVQRILTAQDFEAHTRRGYATLQAMFESAASRTGVRTSTPQPGPEANGKAADDYVRLMTEVEEGFYVTHYTDAQLAAVAAYLESEPGQAILTRLPKVRKALSAVLGGRLSEAISALPDQVCKTVTCSPAQRSNLAEFTTVMAAAASNLPVLTESPG